MGIQKQRDLHFLKLCGELAEQFHNKNLHYGDDFFSGNYEPLEDWMSIKRKVARLDAYYKGISTSSLPDETIDDTWRDLAVYCIMALMKRGLEVEKNE